MKHLLLFTIGPVQSFIAQARKTHDLYAGSRLLSDLMKTAFEVVGDEHVIFPDPKGCSFPNRFLAEIPANVTALQEFGQKVEEAVRLEWQLTADRVLDKALRKIGRSRADKPLGFDQQIASFLEIYWVIEPLKEDGGFRETVLELEKNLAAIKNIRPFGQYTWQEPMVGERGRKCSLDGQRNVQFYKPSSPKNTNISGSPLYATVGSVVESHKFPENMIQSGEGLSSVSFVKRNYKVEQFEVKSTAEIALLEALHVLQQSEKGPQALATFKSHFANDNFNPQFYYEEGLSELFLQKQGVDPGKRKELLGLRKGLSKIAADEGRKFQKYYAILTFDGDNMGKWLSGEYLREPGQLRTFQKSFAECLSRFAQRAKTIIENSAGQYVYAGGDDFLGFLNLNHLLPQLANLRNLFTELVDTPLQNFKKNAADKISFSAGICVAHYKEPLSLVLQEARKAQHVAKDHDGKDSFAINVLKGSGESHTTVLPFGSQASNVKALKFVVEALIREDFSTNFISALQREFEKVDTLARDRRIYQELFKVETSRLLKRSAHKDKTKEKTETMKETLVNLYMTTANSTVNFFQMLHIANFLHRELDTKSIVSAKSI